MFIPLPLLFLFIGSTSAKKKGDFGIIKACTFNNSLRLDCLYPDCKGSPPFSCEFMTPDGVLLNNTFNNCTLILHDHKLLNSNKTSYNCTLTRKERKEKKQITIDYSIKKGKKKIVKCSGTPSVLLHRAGTFLWPVVALTLWTLLGADSQT